MIPTVQLGQFGLAGKRAVVPVTWDAAALTGSWSLTNGGRTAEVTGGTSVRSVVSTTGFSAGKRYFEIVFDSGSSYGDLVRHDLGVTRDKPVASGSSIVGAGIGYRRSGKVQKGGSSVFTATALTGGDVVMVAFDIDAGDVWFGLNGTWLNSGDPGAGTNAIDTTMAAGTYYIGASSESGADLKTTMRVAAGQFSYSVPSGFSAWSS
jgi:hypothetical protein